MISTSTWTTVRLYFCNYMWCILYIDAFNTTGAIIDVSITRTSCTAAEREETSVDVRISECVSTYQCVIIVLEIFYQYDQQTTCSVLYISAKEKTVIVFISATLGKTSQSPLCPPSLKVWRRGCITVCMWLCILFCKYLCSCNYLSTYWCVYVTGCLC